MRKEPISTDFVIAVAEQFGIDTFAYVGTDEVFPAEVQERMPTLKGPENGKRAGVVFLDDCYGDKPADVIRAGAVAVEPGGFLMGTGFNHSDEGRPVQFALAQLYNLMMVQVGPGGIWAIRLGDKQ